MISAFRRAIYKGGKYEHQTDSVRESPDGRGCLRRTSFGVKTSVVILLPFLVNERPVTVRLFLNV